MAPGVKSHRLPWNAMTERWPMPEGYLVPRKQSNQGHSVIRKFSPTGTKTPLPHTPQPRQPNQLTQDSHKAILLVGDVGYPHWILKFLRCSLSGPSPTTLLV